MGRSVLAATAVVDFSLFVDQVVFAPEFFQLNQDWNRVFQLNRRLFAAPFPNAKHANFSFKSATKMRSQMVYELSEKSTI